MAVIVVSGIPGSGKTTLASALSEHLAIPVVSKDVIKESLMDVLGSGDLEWTQTLSRAAHVAMYDLVRDQATPMIVEAHFRRGVAEADLHGLGRPLIQVYCSCPVDVAWSRYRARRSDPDRHPGHRPEHQDDAATAHWRSTEPRPLDLDAPLLEVDTTGRVDVADLAASIRPLLRTS